MIADMTTRPETPTLRTQNYPVFVVLQTLLGVWQKRKYLLLLFDNISIGSSIFMDKYGLLSSIQQSRTKTLLYPMVSSCWCSLCLGLEDAFCLRPWGGSSHEKCQKIETTSLVPISPQAWKSNNIDYIVKLGIVWLNFAVSYSSSQAACFVLRFRVNKVNKSKQSILECSCAKKTACPNQNLLILFLNYNIISMGELHSLVLHGTKRNDQTIQEFKM